MTDGAWAYWEQPSRWTIAQPLWKADSAVAFFTAWRDKPQHLCENFELTNFIRAGRTEEIDDFVRTVLYAYMQLEAII